MGVHELALRQVLVYEFDKLLTLHAFSLGIHLIEVCEIHVEFPSNFLYNSLDLAAG